MPRLPMTQASKILKYTVEFPNEFKKTPNMDLYCIICDITVDYEKKSTVYKHRESAKHLKGKSGCITKHEQSFISANEYNNQNEYTNKVVTAFLSANIPLYKLNNAAMKSLFDHLGRPLPSESTCRGRVNTLADYEIIRIKKILTGKHIFMVVDETEICGKKYFNTLVGSIENPQKTYVFDCRVCLTSSDHQYVVHLVDDVIKKLDVDRRNFALFLSDAARYMTAAGKVLKLLFPNLFHVTCISHIFHNCAEKVRAFYMDVDNMISRVKAATVKNKERTEAFKPIGMPPQPIITRWASWLRAAVYYADNLPMVRSIVNNFKGDGILVKRAKEAVSNPDLGMQLFEIKNDYECLIHMVEESESTNYDIITAYEHLMSIDFGKDICNIKEYIFKRLQKNTDILTIAKLTRETISPSQYCLLQRCQATSISVERSFSMLKKVVCKDRPFHDDNVIKYFMMYYNSVTEF